MQKMTMTQMREIMEQTPKHLKGTQQKLERTLGYFTKAGANWSYLAGWTYDGDLVVTRFGEVM